MSQHHHARERRQTDEQKAEAIISARLKKLGWGKKGTCNATQKRRREGGAFGGPAPPSYDEFEMDSPALRNGILDTRF